MKHFFCCLTIVKLHIWMLAHSSCVFCSSPSFFLHSETWASWKTPNIPCVWSVPPPPPHPQVNWDRLQLTDEPIVNQQSTNWMDALWNVVIIIGTMQTLSLFFFFWGCEGWSWVLNAHLTERNKEFYCQDLCWKPNLYFLYSCSWRVILSLLVRVLKLETWVYCRP